jgi:hypothetical protein
MATPEVRSPLQSATHWLPPSTARRRRGAQALRTIVEDADFVHSEFNKAFVLMQYFGYLRRDPDDAGFNLWLNKLNQFNGNFVQAEMVKAFITSVEYRQRFGQQ